MIFEFQLRQTQEVLKGIQDILLFAQEEEVKDTDALQTHLGCLVFKLRNAEGPLRISLFDRYIQLFYHDMLAQVKQSEYDSLRADALAVELEVPRESAVRLFPMVYRRCIDDGLMSPITVDNLYEVSWFRTIMGQNIVLPLDKADAASFVAFVQKQATPPPVNLQSGFIVTNPAAMSQWSAHLYAEIVMIFFDLLHDLRVASMVNDLYLPDLFSAILRCEEVPMPLENAAGSRGVLQHHLRQSPDGWYLPSLAFANFLSVEDVTHRFPLLKASAVNPQLAQSTMGVSLLAQVQALLLVSQEILEYKKLEDRAGTQKQLDDVRESVQMIQQQLTPNQRALHETATGILRQVTHLKTLVLATSTFNPKQYERSRSIVTRWFRRHQNIKTEETDSEMEDVQDSLIFHNAVVFGHAPAFSIERQSLTPRTPMPLNLPDSQPVVEFAAQAVGAAPDGYEVVGIETQMREDLYYYITLRLNGQERQVTIARDGDGKMQLVTSTLPDLDAVSALDTHTQTALSQTVNRDVLTNSIEAIRRTTEERLRSGRELFAEDFDEVIGEQKAVFEMLRENADVIANILDSSIRTKVKFLLDNYRRSIPLKNFDPSRHRVWIARAKVRKALNAFIRRAIFAVYEMRNNLAIWSGSVPFMASFDQEKQKRFFTDARVVELLTANADRSLVEHVRSLNELLTKLILFYNQFEEQKLRLPSEQITEVWTTFVERQGSTLEATMNKYSSGQAEDITQFISPSLRPLFDEITIIDQSVKQQWESIKDMMTPTEEIAASPAAMSTVSRITRFAMDISYRWIFPLALGTLLPTWSAAILTCVHLVTNQISIRNARQRMRREDEVLLRQHVFEQSLLIYESCYETSDPNAAVRALLRFDQQHRRELILPGRLDRSVLLSYTYQVAMLLLNLYLHHDVAFQNVWPDMPQLLENLRSQPGRLRDVLTDSTSSLVSTARNITETVWSAGGADPVPFLQQSTQLSALIPINQLETHIQAAITTPEPGLILPIGLPEATLEVLQQPANVLLAVTNVADPGTVAEAPSDGFLSATVAAGSALVSTAGGYLVWLFKRRMGVRTNVADVARFLSSNVLISEVADEEDYLESDPMEEEWKATLHRSLPSFSALLRDYLIQCLQNKQPLPAEALEVVANVARVDGWFEDFAKLSLFFTMED